MLYYFKKGKNATEMHKMCSVFSVQCMEKVLWLIEYVKIGLQNFMLEIYHCMTNLNNQLLPS